LVAFDRFAIVSRIPLASLLFNLVLALCLFTLLYATMNLLLNWMIANVNE